MNLVALLDSVQNSITDRDELSYFLIHKVRYLRILEKIQGIAKGKNLRILDIGCFPYHIGSILEKMKHNVYGIASEHEPIREKNISVVNIEKEIFPYKENFFDLVLFNEVIEHLPLSPFPALFEIKRVLKLEGMVMVTTPNIARSINRGKMLLGKSVMYSLDAYYEKDKKGSILHHRHNREYTLSELTQIIKETGLAVVEKGYFISYTPFRKKLTKDSFLLKLGKILNHIGMNMFPSLQDTLFVLAQKK